MSLLSYILGKNYTDLHNSKNDAHSDIRTKIGTDIGTHNSASAAHGGNTGQIGKVYDSRGAAWKTVWVGTQAQYDAIVPPDANTLYLIEEA